MPDLYDQASEVEELFREVALRHREAQGPLPAGECLHCGELLPKVGMRWCDADCRDDYYHAQARASANAEDG